MTERILMGGTDGFRGAAQLDEAGPGKINEETFAALSAALAQYVRESGDSQPIVVGMDTRPSGPRLKDAVIAGVQSQGLEAIDLGIAPTPLAQHTAELMGAAGTIVVTASHNEASDNGWKGMIGARKPQRTEVAAISDRYWDLVDGGFRSISAEAAPQQHAESSEQYIMDVVRDVEAVFGERPLAGKLMVVDGAYGAGSEITPLVLRELGATIKEFACGPDGVINKDSGAAHLEGLQSFLNHNPEITNDPCFLGAVANDGDADRVLGIGMLGGELQEISGNHMMWALAQDQPGIVGTLYTNSGLRDALDRKGVGFDECDNGDVHVTHALHARQQAGDNWTRGGEFTGHLIDTDWLSSGDGIRMAAWFAAWTASRGMTFGDVYEELPLWHEVMKPVAVRNPKVAAAILAGSEYQFSMQELQEQYGDNVRMVVRASGTEPKIRIWSESREQYYAEQSVRKIGGIVTELARTVWP